MTFCTTPLRAFIITLLCLATYVGMPSFAHAQRKAKKQKNTIVSNDSLLLVKDSIITKTGKAPAYRIKDRYSNRFIQRNLQSPLILKDPKNVKDNFVYNPTKNEVAITEKIIADKAKDGLSYRPEQSLSMQQYDALQSKYVRQNILRDYENQQNGISATSGRGLQPLLEKGSFIDRIFGSNTISAKPNGFVTLDFRYLNQYQPSTTTPVAFWNRSTFDFRQHINTNLNTQIGDKMGFIFNFDTQAAFNFDNKLKLNFKNQPEDILQALEVGNISFPIQSQLIPGVQNLFGLKAKMRFGKLDVTAVASQQRSRTQSIRMNNGAQSRPFEVRCDNYDENKHFFLGHFFRDNYESALKRLPAVLSDVRITRVEVYVTNRTNNLETMRNLAVLTDLGESNPFSKNIKGTAKNIADNKASNDLFTKINDNSDIRNVDNVSSIFREKLSFVKGDDFEILRGAKRLSDREYKVQPQLGYISLVTALRNDEVLAVAYEYSYKGQTYKVGELTEDYASRKDNEVIILKMLKSSTIRSKTNQPMWDLMMKNVYSLNTTQINRQGFQLRMIYKDDKTGIDNPNLQEGINTKNVPLLRLFDLDNLNSQNDRIVDANNKVIGDGNFDFVEDITIDTRMGKLFLPVLEPFGSNGIGKDFTANESDLKNKYVYDELYRSTLSDAQQITTKNKFFFRGNFQSANGTEVQLPIGVTAQSVKVFAGGQELRQGADFTVDAQLGRVRITNPSVLNSAREIRVDYEQPDLFNTQIRTMLGTRLDYNASRDLHIGGTFMSLRETPAGSLTRVAIGNEPVNNIIFGTDIQFRKDSRWLTRQIDKLVSTKETSAIQFSGEYAQLIPGVSNRVGGNSMIDDFEATRSIYDLTGSQATKWRLGSTPPADSFRVKSGTPYGYNFKRAKISAYIIDKSFNLNAGLGTTDFATLIGDNNNVYERPFSIQDIFPGRSIPVAGLQLPINVLDIAYFPSERGMYNYNTNLSNDGLLKNPKENFGSIMRGLSIDNDFDNSNIEYIEFYMLDPFMGIVKDGIKNQSNNTGGKLLLQLGDISEDVIPNERFDFENGLQAGSIATPNDSTQWGHSPRVQFLTDAFENQDGTREKQDIGLDGLSDVQENNFPHIKDFLSKINVNAAARAKIQQDPSADDFEYAMSDQTPGIGLVQRYKNFMGMENNSPFVKDLATISNNQTGGTGFIASNNAMPDKEDINGDNTINDVEGYYQYNIDLKPNTLAVNNGYIIDKITNNGLTWYLYRIPIRKFSSKYGNINGFKSMRFMRMVMTDFEQPIVLRLASFQIVGNQYRTYRNQITNIATTTDIPLSDTTSTVFKLGTVSVEENGCGDNIDCSKLKPGVIPYVVPPGFVRDRDFTQQTLMQFNEQSIKLCVDNLKDGDSRAVFKNAKYNMVNYERLRMFVHMENIANELYPVGAFIRIGTDLSQNYYEIALDSLQVSSAVAQLATDIWPANNFFDVAISDLIQAKSLRDQGKPIPYTYSDQTYTDGKVVKYTISVVGRPDLSSVQTIMLGMRNPKSPDNQANSYCVWFDELRTYGYNKQAGYAALANANIKLADIGTLSLNGSIRTFGFGAVQDRISDRAREQTRSFGIVTNLFLEKFTPDSWRLKIPFFLNYDTQTIQPNFDPLNNDMSLEESLKSKKEPEKYRQLVSDNNTRWGYNFSNVRRLRNPDAPHHFFDFLGISNFSFTYAQNTITKHNILLDEYTMYQKRGGITYTYSPKPLVWEPFKNTNVSNILKEFNINVVPNLVAFRTDFDRYYLKNQLRSADLTTTGMQPTYEQYFKMNRFYDLQWNLTKSVSLTFGANMNALIDEPYGDLTDSSKKILNRNFWRLGRAKNFDQKIAVIYRIPTEKIYLLDWVQADAKALTAFRYQAGSLNLTDANNYSFGNTVSNAREIGVQGKIDFVKLYNKLRYLRFANSPTQSTKRQTRNPGDDEDIEIQPNHLLKDVARVLMTIRGINFNYTIQQSTLLPGFMRGDSSVNSFQDFSSSLTPNFAFAVFGQQDYDLLNTNNSLRNSITTQHNWLSKSSSQSQAIIQTRKTHFDFSINLEPVKNFRVQIKGFLDKGDNYQENLFYDAAKGQYITENPVRGGSYSTSFFSWNSFDFLFAQKYNSTYDSKIFDNFRAYRGYFNNELKNGINSVSNGEGTYSNSSQDVLIPSFFAAYTGKTKESVLLDVKNNKLPFIYPFFGFLPMPNWRVDYSGLADIYPFKNYFSSLTLAHSFVSTYNVGSFTSSDRYGNYNLEVAKLLTLGSNVLYPTAQTALMIDNSRGAQLLNDAKEFMPVFVMSTISLSSKFSPLVGLQFTTKKNISGKFEYGQERIAVLNLSNSNLVETTNWDWTFGFGFKKKGVKLPFRDGNGGQIVLKNDLNITFQWRIEDQKILIRKLDGDAQPSQGQYINNFRIGAQYEVNRKISTTFSVDRRVNTPFVSSLFPSSNTVVNLQVKFNLAEL